MDGTNLAYERAAKPQGKSLDIRHTIKLRLTREKKALYSKMAIVIVFVVLGSMSILVRNVANTETGNRIKKLKEEYTALCAENQQKEVEIGKKIDLKTIEEIAVSSYGMNRAKKEQIIHINVSGQDYGVVTYVPKPKENDKNFNVIASIMEYFK